MTATPSAAMSAAVYAGSVRRNRTRSGLPPADTGGLTWVDRPVSRLSNRATRKPRSARAWQNPSGHMATIWKSSPAMSSSGSPPTAPKVW
jgi:hypothetical protein